MIHGAKIAARTQARMIAAPNDGQSVAAQPAPARAAEATRGRCAIVAHLFTTRGSSKAYDMSTRKFTRTKIAATMAVMAMMAGKSTVTALRKV